VTDKHNTAPPSYVVPLAVFAAMFAITAGLGLQTSFAINPARDLGPRIVTAIVGYGADVWSYRHEFWLWGCICAPFAGGLTAAFLYDALVYVGDESFINRPCVILALSSHFIFVYSNTLF
jgi:aquaglyceroporin related protein